MLTILTGFIASIAHVVTGPDHLAAVTPLAIDSRKKSWMVGLSWGLGHTMGMLLIGLLFILFKEFLPVEAIAKHSDTVIGFLLIMIGGWAIVRTWLRHSHAGRSHPVDVDPHGHEHVHTVTTKQNVYTALSIGVIHGFAGFSHLFALLPSLALPTVMASVLYISAFAAGTILTMVLFAFILGIVAFRSVVNDKQVFLKWFTFTGGILAIAIGILWLVHPV